MSNDKLPWEERWKEALDYHDAGTQHADWQSMNRMLDGEPRRYPPSAKAIWLALLGLCFAVGYFIWAATEDSRELTEKSAFPIQQEDFPDIPPAQLSLPALRAKPVARALRAKPVAQAPQGRHPPAEIDTPELKIATPRLPAQRPAAMVVPPLPLAWPPPPLPLRAPKVETPEPRLEVESKDLYPRPRYH